jgi:uncharacterized protein (TIGR02271 family)
MAEYGTVVGYFSSQVQAEAAVNALKRAGFQQERIRKEVSTTTESVEVPVTRKELVVERVPVSGQQVASNATFTSEEMRIPLSEEQVSVEKQAVAREEVRIGKKDVTSVESFDEQVRREELKVDQDTKSAAGRSA